MELIDKNRWNELFSSLENPHILQTYEWGELKSNFGWHPYRVEHNGFPIQILIRNLPFGFKIAYIPKSKADLSDSELWKSIDKFCRSHSVVFLKVEPDSFINTDEKNHHMDKLFIIGKPIQPRRTIEIDLSGDENVWLERMKQKTRYNIKLAAKKGIYIEESDDISIFYNLVVDTSLRDQFGVHSKKYYQLAFDLLKPENKVGLLLAKYEDTPLAGLMVFRSGERAWYFYGASNNVERNRMPTYLLQFDAMKWAKSFGCKMYDLWGIPDEDEETLENDFEKRTDGLWGVYRFKRGFGGTVQRSQSAYDRVYQPLFYYFFNLFQKLRKEIN